MVEVDKLFTGAEYKTQVYASESVLDALDDKSNRIAREKFRNHLERYATNGFEIYEPDNVRHEGDGIYRIGIRGDLFRVIGFYQQGKMVFVAIDQFKKAGQKLNASQRKRIEEVKHVRDEQLWKERFDGK